MDIFVHSDDSFYENICQQSADMLKELDEPEIRAHILQALSTLQLRKGKQLDGLLSMKYGLDGIENPTLKQRFLRKLLNLPFKFIGR